MKVGFIGAGHMAAAMARGWRASADGPASMAFTDAGSGNAAELAEEVGGETAAGNRELFAGSDLVVLAFKPDSLGEVAPELDSEAPAVLSLLAATPLEALEDAFPDIPVVRLMPNVAVEVGAGVLCYALGAKVDEELATRVLALLAPLGTTVELPDEQIDAATAVMGCSPAYLAVVAEALEQAGAQEGLDEVVSHELVTEALAGTAALLRKREPLEVRRAVASPGGSTAAGLAALERGAAREAFTDAVRASLERMRGAA
jgi:pyrroline-5-carboxylate reductase